MLHFKFPAFSYDGIYVAASYRNEIRELYGDIKRIGLVSRPDYCHGKSTSLKIAY